MCGIAGFIDLTPHRCDQDLAAIGKAMGERIAHRGPDDHAVWTDAAAGVCFSHRRLSIIDLSPAGRQPMVSQDGRHVVMLNGEIYNHPDMRAALEAEFGAIAWRGHSDTEVLTEYLARKGLEKALVDAYGQFALAVWDRSDRVLSLARDRAGEKPLYWGRVGRSLVFASELKAFAAHPDWAPRVDAAALNPLLRFGVVPAPMTIYQGVRKLRPGYVVSGAVTSLVEGDDGRPYWTFPRPDPVPLAQIPDLMGELKSTLARAVGRQMHADVPLGCFLSGGIDSSLVAALMQSQSARPIRTYSIGFEEEDLNEAPFAAAVAKSLGAEHTELYVSDADAQGLVPSLGDVYDEPFADSSQIPTTILSRLTRRHVTVALSGDAGDELFGGYGRYEALSRLRWVLEAAPVGVRSVFAAALPLAPVSLLGALAKVVSPASASRFNDEKVARTQSFLRLKGPHEAYAAIYASHSKMAALAPQSPPLSTPLDDPELQRDIRPVEAWAAYVDSVFYLPDDILTKVDRASMSASLEVRAPFLDPEVIALSARFPWTIKTRNGIGKWPLRQILAGHVPRALFERPKMGFGVPLAQWLRGGLKGWAEDLLRPGQGFMGAGVDALAAQALWRDHLSGRHDHKGALWPVLMLQQWARSQGVTP